MILPMVLVATAASTKLDLAYAARYYFQGNRKSYQQIYLSNHTGANRRQITKNEFNSYAPMWIDRNHLAWVEAYRKVRSKNPIEGWRDKCRVIVYDVRNSSKRTLAELGSRYLFWGVWPQGKTFNTYEPGPNDMLIPTSFRVSLRGIKKVINIDDGSMTREFGQYVNEDSSELESGKKATLKVGKQDWKLSWTCFTPSFVLDDEKEVAESALKADSVWKGRTSKFTLHGNHVETAFVGADGTGVILTSYVNNKYRQDNFLYKLSRDFSKCELISNRVGSVEVSQDLNLWKGMQVDRREGAMEKLNDGRSVYVNWLFTGNWKTGHQWTVAKGLVDVAASQFRPEK